MRKIRIRKLVPLGHQTLMADPDHALTIIGEALDHRWFVFCEPTRTIVRNLNQVINLLDTLEEVVIMPPVAGGATTSSG